MALAIHDKSPVPEPLTRPPAALVDRYTMKYSAEHAAEYSILTLPRMVFMRKDKYVKHMSWGDLQGLLSFLPPPTLPRARCSVEEAWRATATMPESAHVLTKLVLICPPRVRMTSIGDQAGIVKEKELPYGK